MIPRNDLQAWLEPLADDTEIAIDEDELELIAFNHDGIPTARLMIPAYDNDLPYKHLTTIAHRRGHHWTPNTDQARTIAAAHIDTDHRYPALQAFATGTDPAHTPTLAAETTALLNELQLQQHHWPTTDDPAPHIAGVRALQRHITTNQPHNQ